MFVDKTPTFEVSKTFQLIESLVVYPKLSSPYTIYSLNDVLLNLHPRYTKKV